MLSPCRPPFCQLSVQWWWTRISVVHHLVASNKASSLIVSWGSREGCGLPGLAQTLNGDDTWCHHCHCCIASMWWVGNGSSGSSIIDCLWTWEVKLMIDYIVASVEWVADPLNNCVGNPSPMLRVTVQQGSKDSYLYPYLQYPYPCTCMGFQTLAHH